MYINIRYNKLCYGQIVDTPLCFIPVENDNASVHDNNILLLDISLLKIRRRPSKYIVRIGGCFGHFFGYGWVLFLTKPAGWHIFSILVWVGFEVPRRNENGKKMINMEPSRCKWYNYICIPIINKCKIHKLNFKSVL